MTAQVVTIPHTNNAPTEKVGRRLVDVRRGQLDGTVSRQWFGRPDDQRFLSLDDLYAAVEQRREASFDRVIAPRSIRLIAEPEKVNDLTVAVDGREMAPTNWSFQQLAMLAGAPAGYLRSLPAYLSAANLQYGLMENREGDARILGKINGAGQLDELRAATSPTYGRIWDSEVVRAVQNTADDTWKVPGVINWATGEYDPDAPITKASTTLYASDRDVFIFLVRDQYPVEVGKLPNGEPDYLFPGFIVSNSEVGSRSLCLEMMYLRAVCQNRNLWGVEDKQSKLRIRHSSGAPERWAASAVPQLEAFASVAAGNVRRKVEDARAALIAKDDEERIAFLRGLDFSAKAAKEIIEVGEETDGRKPSSVWDMVQAITASARDIVHQDARIDVERKAGALMDRV